MIQIQTIEQKYIPYFSSLTKIQKIPSYKISPSKSIREVYKKKKQNLPSHKTFSSKPNRTNE